MKRRKSLWIILALALSATSVLWAADQKPAPRPHVVLIVADDLGWKDIGFHGSEIRTPRLDGLAEAGAQLDQFYVQPVCSPTRAALMTGRYPMRTGMQVGVVRPWAEYGLPLAERTLAQALKEVGYHTVICGKWHLGCHERAYLPRQRGFDHQYGHYLGAIDYFTHERMGGLDWHRNERPLREEGYSTDLIAREAVQVIREHDASKPLFLYVPFNAPHAPLQAPQEYLDRYKHLKGKKRPTYAAMVACMDDGIGRILEAVSARGLREDTLILFCSDNGGPTRSGADNGKLRGGKGTLYEGGLRVPAIAVWPGRIKPGAMVREPLHIVDWYPMLLNLAGARLEQPLPIDGLDAWPVIAEGKPSPHKEILHQHEPSRAAIRQGDWKLIVNERPSPKREADPAAAPIELFDLSVDPYEKKNLADAQPEKVRALQARLAVYAQQAAPPPAEAGKNEPTDYKAPAVWGDTE